MPKEEQSTGDSGRKLASRSVSVIIPNYNTARFITETLDSVFRQTRQSDEVIVINDGAPDSDELREVLKPYLGKIIFIDEPVNQGTSRVRNIGAARATGELLAFLDADDIWQPTFLEELTAFLTAGDMDVAYTDAETFGVASLDGKLLPGNPPQGGTISRRTLIEGRCHILPSGTLIRRRLFDAVGGFDTKVKRTEDFDLWMRLLFKGARVGYLKKVLFKFRVRPDSGSGDYLVRLQRCVDSWHQLRAKLDFTPEENAIIDRHIAVQESAVVRARGRMALAQHKWEEARSEFTKASTMARDLSLPRAHRLKLAAVMLGLRLAPSLVAALFNRSRPEEIELISAIDSSL